MSMTVPETVVCNRQHKHESERKSSDRHEECIISKPEIAHKPSLLGAFEDLYGKGKPVSVGRPCDVCGKDCKIKGLGLPLCCRSNLQKKVNIDETGVCNRQHKHESERKSSDRHEECIISKPEIAHKPSLLGPFEDLYGKGKPVSVGRPCDVSGKDCKIKGLGLHLCGSNLLPKKLSIDETGVCNRKHKNKHEFERKSSDRTFKCNGCKVQGSGLRYQCDRCDYELHEECILPELEISLEGSLFRFFEEPQPDYVKGEWVLKERCCDACAEDIRGFNYNCKTKGWDIHPCCRNLQLATSRTEGRKGKCKYGWVVTLFLNTIRAIFLGDPIGLISQAVSQAIVELLNSS